MTQEVSQPGEQAAVPVCYRHGDRETYVRCVRCDRPICPDCMRAASVGFQCPECVREGAKSIRQPRTSFGGRVTRNDNNVTLSLIGINLAVYVVAGLTNPAALTRMIGTTLHERFALVGVQVAEGEFYRLVTSAFLHYGPLHIAFNMYALWLFGQELERLYGRVRFTVLYFVSALGGGVLAYLVTNPHDQLAGASGAVFGLFGAYFITARKLGLRTGGILALVGINLVFGFVVPNIGWTAHIGGLITGAAMAAVIAYAPRGARRDLVQIAGTALIVIGLCVAIVVRTAQLTA